MGAVLATTSAVLLHARLAAPVMLLGASAVLLVARPVMLSGSSAVLLHARLARLALLLGASALPNGASAVLHASSVSIASSASSASSARAARAVANGRNS